MILRTFRREVLFFLFYVFAVSFHNLLEDGKKTGEKEGEYIAKTCHSLGFARLPGETLTVCPRSGYDIFSGLFFVS